MIKKILPGVLFIAFSLLFSCVSAGPVSEDNGVADPTPEPEKAVLETSAAVEEEPEETIETSAEEVSFTVTDEIYKRTFQDIENLIQDLNSLIQKNNYDAWLSYLSLDYIQKYSDLQVLKELSEQPLLQKYNITLSSLKDYFDYVVVPSRSNARLDDILFEDEYHIKAIMLVNGKRSILYQLVYIDDRWKIGL